MGRSQETFNKKEVRKQKEKKRKEKEKKRQARKEEDKKSMDDMIAYVDEYGNITDTPPDPEEKDEVKAEDITIGAANRNTAEDLDPVKKVPSPFSMMPKDLDLSGKPNQSRMYSCTSTM